MRARVEVCENAQEGAPCPAGLHFGRLTSCRAAERTKIVNRRRLTTVLATSLLAAATVIVPTGTSSASGIAYGRPADCSVTYLCIYDSSNFLAWLSSFAADNPSWSGYNAWNDDTSAYNAGSVTWDVLVFSSTSYGGGFYCLKPGRGWLDLGQFPGSNNNGESNDWRQNYCA